MYSAEANIAAVYDQCLLVHKVVAIVQIWIRFLMFSA